MGNRGRLVGRKLLAVLAAASLAAGLLPFTPVQALDYTTMCAGGKIAFASNRDGNSEIYLMNLDGSGQTRLTNHTASDSVPAWSPDASQIAFGSNRLAGVDHIFVMNSDGVDVQQLTKGMAPDAWPAWSPNGTKMAFASLRDGNFEIYVMKADGSGQTRLTNNTAIDIQPAWSPDGTKMAFASLRDGNLEIYVMNADGSGQTRLTNNTAPDIYPDWSPDGLKIAFASNRAGGFAQIYVMNSDGTGVSRLTNNAVSQYRPSWSPDGGGLAFVRANSDAAGGPGEIYTMKTDGSAQMRLTNNGVFNGFPDWVDPDRKVGPVRRNTCKEFTNSSDPFIREKLGDHRDKWVVVGNANPVFQHRYPPLIGRPGLFVTAKGVTVKQDVGRYQAGPLGTGDIERGDLVIRNIARCRQVTWCDVIPLIVQDVAKRFSITIVLSWEGDDLRDEKGEVIRDPTNPARTKLANNVDFFVWEQITTVRQYEDGTEVVTPETKVSDDVKIDETRVAVYRDVLGNEEEGTTLNLLGNTGATFFHPEIVQLADLPPTRVNRFCTSEDYTNPCTFKKPAKQPIGGPAVLGDTDPVSGDPQRSPRCPETLDVSHKDQTTGIKIDHRVELIRKNPLLQPLVCPEMTKMWQFSEYLIVVANFAHDKQNDPSLEFENKGYTLTTIYRPFVREQRGSKGGGYTPIDGLLPKFGVGLPDEVVAAIPELEPVKVPGPDGPLVDMELFALKGQTSEPPRKSRVPLVAFAGAFVGIGGLTFLTFLFRRRILGAPK